MATDYPIAAAVTSGNCGGEGCYHNNVRDPSSTGALRTAEGAEDERDHAEKEKEDEPMISRAFGAPSAVRVSSHLDSAPPPPMRRDN